MKRHTSLWVQSIFLVVLIGAVTAYLYQPDRTQEAISGYKADKESKGKKRRRNKKIPVIVEQVTETNNDNIIEAIGDGRAVRFVTLYPESPGEVIRLLVKSGDKVKKDDIILELASRKAALAVKVAQTKLVEAQRKLERSEQLRRQKVTAKANVDDAATALRRAKLELQQAEEALNDRVLRAPFDGFVGIPKVEPGDRVSTNSAIVTLDDRSSLTVEFDVPEHFHSQVRDGQKILAQTPSFSGKIFNGTVKAIDSRVDSTSRSVKVRAEIPNKNDMLRPGMSFAVQIVISGKAYATVPELALQWGKGVSYVWRVNDGKAKKTVVRMVRRINSNILVEGEIAKGDIIVVEGVQRLRDGVNVYYPKSPKSAGKNLSKLDSKNGRTR